MHSCVVAVVQEKDPLAIDFEEDDIQVRAVVFLSPGVPSCMRRGN
jgi:hypothetical protein